MEPLPIDIQNSCYQAMIGVGGIGTGVFFALDGNHTLGREESRGGHFLERRDYCKLHIISHYVKTLLGPDFETILIGRVGDDKEGQQLLSEMSDAGLDLRYVETVPGRQTLYSFCFVYPDGSGGNLTTDDSANATVDEALVGQAALLFAQFRARGIALAAPETSLSARQHLLTLGTEHDFLRVASLTSLEIASQQVDRILEQTNLLALNLDEASTLGNVSADRSRPLQVVEAAIEGGRKFNPDMLLSITGGREGSWVWDGLEVHHRPIIPVKAASTAGAGDAHLAGLLSGLVAGLPLPRAHELASVVAALSVTSPHTIHPSLDCRSLQEFVKNHEVELSGEVEKLLVANPN
jgi:sugar/nucleoside kinase (ribokinase family)